MKEGLKNILLSNSEENSNSRMVNPRLKFTERALIGRQWFVRGKKHK